MLTDFLKYIPAIAKQVRQIAIVQMAGSVRVTAFTATSSREVAQSGAPPIKKWAYVPDCRLRSTVPDLMTNMAMLVKNRNGEVRWLRSLLVVRFRDHQR